MLRNIAVIGGALLSGVMGYVVFQITGLCEACESSTLKYIMGFSIGAVCLIGFKSGVRGIHDRRKTEISAGKEEWEVFVEQVKQKKSTTDLPSSSVKHAV